MRGLRFVMENNTGSDQAWLDETQLAVLLDDPSGIETGIPERQSADSPYRVQGTGACWMPARPMRILFEYPEYRPAKLATLIRQAIARLDNP